MRARPGLARRYRRVFDAEVVNERDPVMLKVANSWLILWTGARRSAGYVRDPDGHLIEVGQATGVLERD